MPSIAVKDAGLELAYEDAGPRAAPAVLLLHGWPDDASTWNEVGALLREAGLRTITPTVRGFGASRFVSPDAPRTGNSTVLTLDVIALLDALAVDRVFVAGHDWGSHTAEAMAIGWPDRVERLAMLSSKPRFGGTPKPSFEQAQRQWYHWFQATKRGAEAIRADRKGFAHLMWRNWSPEGWFDAATFDRVALSFENPDWVDVTLHSYQSRWGEAELDPRSKALDDKVKATKSLPIPTLYFQGEADGVNPPSTSMDLASKFTGPFERIVLPSVGHFPTREAPDEVAAHLIAHFTQA